MVRRRAADAGIETPIRRTDDISVSEVERVGI